MILLLFGAIFSVCEVFDSLHKMEDANGMSSTQHPLWDKILQNTVKTAVLQTDKERLEIAQNLSQGFQILSNFLVKFSEYLTFPQWKGFTDLFLWCAHLFCYYFLLFGTTKGLAQPVKNVEVSVLHVQVSGSTHNKIKILWAILPVEGGKFLGSYAT